MAIMKIRFVFVLVCLSMLTSAAYSEDWFDRLLKAVAKPDTVFVKDSSGVKKEVPQRNPLKPETAETHVVELYKVQISDDDFHRSSFGNPLKIRISLLENGIELPSSNITVPPILLWGTRGERFLDRPIQWTVNFDPKKNYQIVLEEQAIVAQAWSWLIPKTPKLGIWPIGAPDGLIRLGRDSYIQFHDMIAK
jgi:hypothetical protein